MRALRRAVKIVAIGAKIVMLQKYQIYHWSYMCGFLDFNVFTVEWTQKRLSITFLVIDCPCLLETFWWQNSQELKMWSMTGVRKQSWHAKTECVNKLVFGRKSYWKQKQLRTKLVNLCYIWQNIAKCIESRRVYSKNQYWFISSSCTPLVLCQTSDRNSQHCKFLTFL